MRSGNSSLFIVWWCLLFIAPNQGFMYVVHNGIRLPHQVDRPQLFNHMAIGSGSGSGSSDNNSVKKIAVGGNTLITGQQVVRCRDFSVDGQRTFKFSGSFHSCKEIPLLPLPDIAFVGRSNVGKSSMLNCLAGGNKPLARESKTPGRTRAINMFQCADAIGDICMLVDLPGYGFAKMSKSEKEELSQVVHEYLISRESLMLCVVLVDPRRGPMESDYSLIKMLVEEGVPFVIAATKTDKLSKSELTHSITTIAEAYGLPSKFFVPFSSITGNGRKEIWRIIRDSIQRIGLAYSLLTNE